MGMLLSNWAPHRSPLRAIQTSLAIMAMVTSKSKRRKVAAGTLYRFISCSHSPIPRMWYWCYSVRWAPLPMGPRCRSWPFSLAIWLMPLEVPWANMKWLTGLPRYILSLYFISPYFFEKKNQISDTTLVPSIGVFIENYTSSFNLDWSLSNKFTKVML